jgi:quercetin dioxygenase-like cupin family protein
MMLQQELVLKRFEKPDETREIEKCKFEFVRIGGLTIVRATYQPGWKWSEHLRPVVGTEFCHTEHVGLVVSGHATADMKDGIVHDLVPGTLFHIPPQPHDSWVIGDEPCVLLHFMTDACAGK